MLSSCGLSGATALGLDRRLVQPGRAEVGDLARGRSRRRVARVVEQLRDALAGQLVDLVASTPAFLALRDLGGLEPSAVGVGEEVVARLDGRIHRAFEHSTLFCRSTVCARSARAEHDDEQREVRCRLPQNRGTGCIDEHGAASQ